MNILLTRRHVLASLAASLAVPAFAQSDLSLIHI